jgi:hypothetical protein
MAMAAAAAAAESGAKQTNSSPPMRPRIISGVTVSRMMEAAC